MRYICFTADVINSRAVEHERYLNNLSEKLEFLNDLLHPLVPVSLNAGDELQGLWSDNINILETLILFQACISPLAVRVGIGHGSLTSKIHPYTRDMRGEVFILAREALQKTKEQRVLVTYRSFEQEDHYFNTIVMLVSTITRKWDAITYRRFLLYRESGDIYSVARQEGVSPEAINKYVNRHNIRIVLKAMNKK